MFQEDNIFSASGVLAIKQDETMHSDEPPQANKLVPLEGEYYNTYENYFDVAGNGSLPSYGMQQIVIVGQRLSSYLNFDSQQLSFYEFSNLVSASEGGSGSGGSGNGCLPKGQRVSWSFVEYSEGNLNYGTVPHNSAGQPYPNAGVTIASGFDLGERTVQSLQQLGFPGTLVDKLSPYLHMKGAEAENYENAHPLTIDPYESTIINAASHSQALASIAVAYGKAIGEPGGFYKLPTQAQTAIADLSFQYGNLQKTAPNFWNQIVGKDWSAAIENLRNFGDDFVTRRNREADLLENALTSGALKNGSMCGM